MKNQKRTIKNPTEVGLFKEGLRKFHQLFSWIHAKRILSIQGNETENISFTQMNFNFRWLCSGEFRDYIEDSETADFC